MKTYPVKSARNLGVSFDINFNFRSHISVTEPGFAEDIGAIEV